MDVEVILDHFAAIMGDDSLEETLGMWRWVTEANKPSHSKAKTQDGFEAK